MKTTVTFRHTQGQHPRLQEKALEYAGGFEKYYDGIVSTDVEFLNEKKGKSVQIKTHVQGATLVAESAGEDFDKALHETSEKIIRQIRKHKTKINPRI